MCFWEVKSIKLNNRMEGGENMKKKKQQTRNLIILAIVTVGIVLGLWAMNSSLNLNSNASGNCTGGSFGILNGNCYEMWPRPCNGGCCSKKVSMNRCEDYKYNPKKFKKSASDCKGNGYDTDKDGNCYLIDGKVCDYSGNIGNDCCNKKVDKKFCQ